MDTWKWYHLLNAPPIFKYCQDGGNKLLLNRMALKRSKKSTPMKLTKLSMRMEWGLGLSTTNSWKDTMLEIWCSSWPARAKTVKGTKKTNKQNWTTLWLDPLSTKVRRQLEIRFEYSHAKKNSLTKKNLLNYVVTWSFIHEGT